MDFEKIVAGGAAGVEAMVAARLQEDLNLDFKSGRMFQNGELDRTNREALGAALSAFSNAMGGVLIIGVKATKQNGIDCANELVPVSDLEKAETSAKDACMSLLQGRHEGIRVTSLRLPEDPSSGFLVIDVPRSPRRPHMSQADHRYYKRSGTSSVMMEHYEVEDTFRSTNSPELTLDVDLVRRETQFHLSATQNYEIGVNLAVGNRGRVSAKHVIIQVLETAYPMMAATKADGPGRASEHRGVRTLEPPTGLVIHPEQSILVHRVWFEVLAQPNRASIIGGGTASGPLSINYRLSAENFISPIRTLSIPLGSVWSACYGPTVLS